MVDHAGQTALSQEQNLCEERRTDQKHRGKVCRKKSSSQICADLAICAPGKWSRDKSIPQ